MTNFRSACNWSGYENDCDLKEVDEAIQRIDKQCGERNPGWLEMGDWAKSYGREVDGVEICYCINVLHPHHGC